VTVVGTNITSIAVRVVVVEVLRVRVSNKRQLSVVGTDAVYPKSVGFISVNVLTSKETLVTVTGSMGVVVV